MDRPDIASIQQATFGELLGVALGVPAGRRRCLQTGAVLAFGGQDLRGLVGVRVVSYSTDYLDLDGLPAATFRTIAIRALDVDTVVLADFCFRTG